MKVNNHHSSIGTSANKTHPADQGSKNVRPGPAPAKRPGTAKLSTLTEEMSINIHFEMPFSPGEKIFAPANCIIQ